MISFKEYKEQFKKLSTTRKITKILCLPITLTILAFLGVIYALIWLWSFIIAYLRIIVGIALLAALIKYIFW